MPGRNDGDGAVTRLRERGYRGISRVLGVAAGTVLEKIRSIASTIKRRDVGKDQSCFEVDELWTYIGKKENEHWVAYALDRKRDVIDFCGGQANRGDLAAADRSPVGFGGEKNQDGPLNPPPAADPEREASLQHLWRQSYRAEEPDAADAPETAEPPDDLFQPKVVDAGKLLADLLLERSGGLKLKSSLKNG